MQYDEIPRPTRLVKLEGLEYLHPSFLHTKNGISAHTNAMNWISGRGLGGNNTEWNHKLNARYSTFVELIKAEYNLNSIIIDRPLGLKYACIDFVTPYHLGEIKGSHSHSIPPIYFEQLYDKWLKRHGGIGIIYWNSYENYYYEWSNEDLIAWTLAR